MILLQGQLRPESQGCTFIVYSVDGTDDEVHVELISPKGQASMMQPYHGQISASGWKNGWTTDNKQVPRNPDL